MLLVLIITFCFGLVPGLHKLTLGQEYRLCCEVVLRQCVGCRPLYGNQGLVINIPLGILSMIFVDLIGLPKRLPFKDEGRDMTRVIMHDWRHVIRQ